jgi:hypothetical protein
MGLKYHVKLPKKNPKLFTPLTISISQSKVSPSSLFLFDLYFLGYFILCVFRIFFSSLSFYFYFYFYFLFLFFHSLVFSFSNRINFSFLASVFFFLIQTENHRYNWVGILKGIIDIIGLEFESVFLFFSWYFFPYS